MALASCNFLPEHTLFRHAVDGIANSRLRACPSAPVQISAGWVPFKCRLNESSADGRATMMSIVTEGRLGGRGGGAGVLERPGLDQSTPDTAPRTEEGGEMGKSRQSVKFGAGDRYRVLLLDHERHSESLVTKVIPRVVPSVTPDAARKCFYESRELGIALVTVAVKEHAEFYVQMLVRSGLRSTMEQDSGIA